MKKQSDQPIRVFITDDHAIVRGGLRALIGGKSDMVLVGEATDGAEAIEAARALQPDIILMDLIMPNVDGITAIQTIREENPAARILVLTSFAEEHQIISALRLGALGYILKETSPEELVEAIRCVARGEATMHPEVARKLVLGQQPSQPKGESLTERETQVLKLVAHGLSNQTIAQELSIGAVTVRFHVSNILSKLQIENRTQAVLYALREGIAKLGD
ncbi:MAG: response regulator transcription factor [Anaerolineae bacterium]|nr:response regulator transcription factor [Anaerolineae bacterium]